ncbi:MAG: photosystem II stability/assembly factor-like uncharacterized protein [Acidimicrobiales bacterium]|jgi:photosystem II stability/assembly factor-like uncharacterized protein
MILAGTSRGVFAIDQDGAHSVLESRGVRDLFEVNGRVFASTGAGLFVSDNAGDTWSCVGLAEYEVWQVRAAPDGTLYAGTQPAGLFRSTDGGDNWTEIESFANAPEAAGWCIPLDPPLPGRARAIVVDREDANKIWVGVEVGGIMGTTDGGQTWTLNRPGDNPDLHNIYAHPAEPSMLFASTGYGRKDHIAEEVEGNAGVLRSDDHGQTWNYAWSGVTPRYSRPMCIEVREPFSLTVASAPNAFSNFADDGGAQAMLFRSDDHGASWRSLCDQAHSPSAANIHGLMVNPHEMGGVIVGTDTGEVWRVSGDAVWTEVATGLPAVLSLTATGADLGL